MSVKSKQAPGADRKLYGTTYSGGTSNKGAVFRIGLDGSSYEVLRHLGASVVDAANPEGGLIEGSDGALYGTTYAGGSNNVGTVFKLNKDGSGYLPLRHFSTTGGSGQFPRGALLEATDGWLYGATYGGGQYSAGTVFKMGKDGNGFLTLRSFFGIQTKKIDARNPVAGLVEGSDGTLYGTSYNGGTNGMGAVFSISKDGTIYQLLHSFPDLGSDGSHPHAGVCEASDGALYGTTVAGGSFGAGTIFKVNKDGSGYARLFNFLSSQVHTPYGALIEGQDGALYGSALAFGSSSTRQGGLFKINKDGSGFLLLHAFNRSVLSYGADGQKPYSGLIFGSDGAFYGTTQKGGDLLDAGIVFKLFTATPPTLAIAPPQGETTRISMTGIAHPRYRIDASSNLIQWVTLTNLPNPTGTVEIEDSIGAAGSMRFYRGVFTP